MSDHDQPPEKDPGLQGVYDALAFDEDVTDAKARVWSKVSSDVSLIASAGTLGGFLGRGFELVPSLKAKVALVALGLMAGGAAVGIAVDRTFVRPAETPRPAVVEAVEPAPDPVEPAPSEPEPEPVVEEQPEPPTMRETVPPRERPQRQVEPAQTPMDDPLPPSELARERTMIDA
ncbi:MAG: hypothetical protein AAGE52_43190, partial [Myxococcota bacterium]